MSRGRHPKKEISDALRRAEDAGLVVDEIHRGHRWGKVDCLPCSASRSVWATPQDAGTHAKQIERFTRNHTHPLPPAGPTSAA
ncbi:hypothetical protein EAD96_30055 [Micromonospora sp. BL1]|nr:hypothetical protein EAD96_30055 [Micromonospora sp. BL1]